MRAGGCTVQQSLTPEAAAVVKQAVTLALRRGHAQVTPLHVANTMLSSSAGLLRAACLQSHSHPLQCKALELCFNVALNRLPASTSAPPMLTSHHHHHHHCQHHPPPSLSNALVAAFKRAQAHQRRGSIESQQQPMLAVKIELEQLIISILDDPSVSRVMREAGFSSTQVKSNVEQAVSLDMCTPTSNPNPNPTIKPKDVITSPQISPTATPVGKVRSEDVMSIVDCLASSKKRRVVVVGECLATTEATVRLVMDRISKGVIDVPEVIKNVQFITLQISSFRHMSREEVDHRIGELRCLVKSYCIGKGTVLLLEDLSWVAEFWNRWLEKGSRSCYCPVEHVIKEVRSLVYGTAMGGEESSGMIGRFWLMGVGTYQTYIKCRFGNPSLEALWGLQTHTIPCGSLGLSLNFDSDSKMKSKRSDQNGSSWSFMDGAVESQLTCADCSNKFDTETRCHPNSTPCSSHSLVSSKLPSWLQEYKEEKGRANRNDQGCVQMRDLCNNWNSKCSSTRGNQHHPSEITLNFSSISPSSSISSYDQRYSSFKKPWLLPLEAKHPWRLEADDEDLELDVSTIHDTKPNLNSNSSSGKMEVDCTSRFKELNAESLKTLCNALEKRVPRQKDIIPEIASAVLRCRSGMMKRKDMSKTSCTKEETWMFFQGGDTDGKERIARELATLVFGSHNSFIMVGVNSSSCSSTDDHRNKRSRSEASHGYLDRLFEAIRENPHRVILMEDIEQVDYYCQLGIKKAIETGRVENYHGDEASLTDAIIILSCESFDSRSRACSPPVKQKVECEEEKEEQDEKEIGSCLRLDLNLCAVDDEQEYCSFSDVGLLEAVDQALFFKLPQDL
ncbi:protein SMAX1-LIKE 3-like [Typha angustifolia]|uniref:protein SMAX1-LIKE 3-like n=1 Tax=Typha angustifolia TaxID=59011 RepID=UPI003C2E1728